MQNISTWGQLAANFVDKICGWEENDKIRQTKSSWYLIRKGDKIMLEIR